ncbi:hypothetical protein AB0F81_37865, partial [Actinoplanes sp. NPDC024001]
MPTGRPVGAGRLVRARPDGGADEADETRRPDRGDGAGETGRPAGTEATPLTGAADTGRAPGAPDSDPGIPEFGAGPDDP